MNNRGDWTLFHVRDGMADAERDALRLRAAGYSTEIRRAGIDRYGNGIPRFEVFGRICGKWTPRRRKPPADEGPTDGELREIEVSG